MVKGNKIIRIICKCRVVVTGWVGPLHSFKSRHSTNGIPRLKEIKRNPGEKEKKRKREKEKKRRDKETTKKIDTLLSHGFWGMVHYSSVWWPPLVGDPFNVPFIHFHVLLAEFPVFFRVAAAKHAILLEW